MNMTTTDSTVMTGNSVTKTTTSATPSISGTFIEPLTIKFNEPLTIKVPLSTEEHDHPKKKKTFKITNVEEIVKGKVIRCTFDDGDVQKAVCHDEDEYSLEAGISICITKHLLGGTSQYNKAVKQGVNCYNKKIKEKEEEKQREEQKKHRREKFEAYKKRRDQKRKEQYIRDHVEILTQALKSVERDRV